MNIENPHREEFIRDLVANSYDPEVMKLETEEVEAIYEVFMDILPLMQDHSKFPKEFSRASFNVAVMLGLRVLSQEGSGIQVPSDVFFETMRQTYKSFIDQYKDA